MLYGLLLTFFIFLGILIILFVLIQQSKSSLGIGAMGGETQMLFGGSGGQNFFQKATWVMGGLFMALSLILALMRSSISETRYVKRISSTTPIVQAMPEEKSATATEVTTEEPATEDNK